MRRTRRLVHAMLLTAATVSALADLTTAEAAAAHSPSAAVSPSTLVLDGRNDSVEQVAAAPDSAPPTVLRGSPPSAAQTHAPYACNPGLDYDPNYGCVAPSYSYAPDYGYWPDYGDWPGFGFGGFDNGRGRRGFRHGFAHVIGRGRALRFGHAFAHNGVNHGFAHAGGGFGRR